ncbi:MAG: substrate-binding domain-containing protein [Candidatus Izimaplasma sp.]|nr:substrate-binding domain-containing protein [Candidatus Izimaplasma bacterium]
MKKLFLLFVAALFVASLSACGGNQVDIGIVLPTQNEERWTQDQERFKSYLDDTDYSYEILFSEGDSQVEASNIDTLISKGMDVLIITAHDSEAAKTAVQNAIDEGVKVIAYDRLIDLEGVSFYVTFDSMVVGNQQAQFLIDNAEGTGNELYLYSGGTWESNAPLFFRGAWEVLQPKIADGTFVVMNAPAHADYINQAELTTEEALEIMTQVDTDWDPAATTTLAQNHVSTFVPADNDTTAYILAPNDFTSRAIRAEFISVYDEVIITGQDADRLSIKSIQDGKQSMTVLKDVRTLVDNAFNIADKLMKGESLPTATHFYGENDVPAVPTEVVVVTQSNLEAAIIESGYYTQEEINDAGQ